METGIKDEFSKESMIVRTHKAFKKIKRHERRLHAAKEIAFDAGHSKKATKDSDMVSRTGHDRIRGSMAKKEILRCLLCQNILRDVGEGVVDEILSKGKVKSFQKGKTITNESDNGGEVYFILRGAIEVKVKGRKIASRIAKDCVGEMSALDPTQKRCASLVTLEKTDVFVLDAETFDNIVSANVKMAKNEAVELCVRLRERSKFHNHPNAIPELFIGSSSEGVCVAERFKEKIESRDLRVRIWTKDVFALSKSNLESLIDEARSCDFAVLVMTPDDFTRCRGLRKMAPRDNVVFELGLFMGSIGRDRTYLLSGSDVKLPTDLDGITRLKYTRQKNNAIKVDDAVAAVRREIHDKGAK